MVTEYTSKKNTSVYSTRFAITAAGQSKLRSTHTGIPFENGKWYTSPCGILGYHTVRTDLKKFENMDYRRIRLLQFRIFSYQLYYRQW